MLNLLSPFIVDLICTCFLFVLSVLIVLGGKMLVLMVYEFVSKKTALSKPVQQIQPKIKSTTPKKSKSTKKPSIVRSIEIDPEHVDKIYVKKSS